MSEDKMIRERLAKHLKGGEAFMTVDEMVKKITFADIKTRPANLPYSFYELFYHITFTQKDILDFIDSDDYKQHKWPDNYWTKEKKCSNEEEWKQLQAEYFDARNKLKTILLNFDTSLMQLVKNGKGEQTLFRELLLVIEHTAYHTGQMLVVLRLLNLH